MQRMTRVLALLSVLILLTASMAAAAPKTTSNGPTQLYHIAGKHGKQILQTLEKLGVQPVDVWEDLDSASAYLTADQAAKFAKHADLDAVDAVPVTKAMGTFNDAFPITWGLDAVNAPEAWAAGATGQGIKLCILDTGIDFNHPEFYQNGVSIVKGSANFVNDGHPTAQDGAGHGTHVAGTIAAQGSTVKGVAPNVELYIGRVLGDDGYSTNSSVVNGVNWCYKTVKAKIISMSLGGTGYTMTEKRAYDNAYAAGTLTIAAAGNAGTSAISYPAGLANVVSVAAVDSNLAKADFSQFNSDVELAGPGVAVYSSVPVGTGLKATTQEGTTTYASNPIEFAPTGTVTGPLVECGLADTTTSCTGIPASGAWVALVSRGTIAFSDKANNVKAQGASAMLLTNNDTVAPDDAGSFTFGAAGSWLPATSVSYNSGVAIRGGGLGTGTVMLEAASYEYYNGTSMATPHASAVAALAWSVKPTLTNATIRSVLQTTAQDLGTAGRDVNFGYGLVKADAAVNLAKTK